METLKNEFSWSVSRQKEFEYCKRKYYYSKYGFWEGWPNGSGDAKAHEIYMLRNLRNKKAWAGSVVHDTIAKVLHKMKRGIMISYAKAHQYLVERMKEDFQNSKNKKYKENPKKIVGLYEHEYGEKITEEDLEELISFASSCLKKFFESMIYEKLSKLDNDNWLYIDSPGFNYFLQGNVKIYVKPDLVFRDGEYIMLVDWKTSQSEGGDHTLQLGCYLAYICEKWHYEPHQVKMCEINLALCQEGTHTGSLKELQAVRKQITENLNEIKTFIRDPDDNKADEEDFPRTHSPAKCRYCNFKRLCSSCD